MYIVGGMCVQIICKCASTAASSSRWWWQHWSSDEAGLLGWSTETEKKCAQFQRETNPCCYTITPIQSEKMVSVPKVQSVQMQTVKNDCRSCRGSLYNIGPLPVHQLWQQLSVESQFFLFSNPLKNLPSSPFFIRHMQNSCVDIQTHAARAITY